MDDISLAAVASIVAALRYKQSYSLPGSRVVAVHFGPPSLGVPAVPWGHKGLCDLLVFCFITEGTYSQFIWPGQL